VINSTKPGAWTSLADGKKPKWFEVDTMSSGEIASLTAEIPHLSTIKEFEVLGMLADDYENIAAYPGKDGEASRGGLTVDVALEQNGEQADQLRRHLKLASTASYGQDGTTFDRKDTPAKGRDGWMVNRISGAFYVPQNRSLELQFMQPPSPNAWQHAYLFVDGELVLGGPIDPNTLKLTKKVDLTKGCHKLEILVRDHWQNSTVTVGYRKDDGTFEALPASWFSIRDHKELADFLKPKGKIAVSGDTLKLDLSEPRRLRKLRIVFKDFAEASVSVKSVVVKDAAGAAILPVKEDFSSVKNSGTLRIAPGDEITVSYTDPKTLTGESATLTSRLNAAYDNGEISLLYEIMGGTAENRIANYYPAKRCRVGDQIVVLVKDFDEDVSDERDTVDVSVQTSSGEKLVLKALETALGSTNEKSHAHAGTFVAILKIGTATGKDTIKLNPGDKLTVSYLDKENTIPGVPIERLCSVDEAGKAKPDLLVYLTNIKLVEDRSPEAEMKRLRMKARDRATTAIYKEFVVAKHPEYQDPTTQPTRPPAKGGETRVSVAAPLLVEVQYPKMAMNQGSTFEIQAVAESELQAAKSENREPVVVKVPMFVENIERLASAYGYPIQLQSHVRREASEMLRDGCFAAAVRLQLGRFGDAINDMVYSSDSEFLTPAQRALQPTGPYSRVPTLLVSGRDTVYLRVKDVESGEVIERKISLMSDPRMELTDDTYQYPTEAIHLGDKFYVKVIDPDHDISDARDSVTVAVKASSGDELKLTLTETLNHSGIFTGNFKPVFIGPKVNGVTPTPDKTDDVLMVNFGDEVTFEYVDDLSVSSDTPVTVTKKGKVYPGSDGEVALFTKKFADPEMAVKTRFLTAEALFEMAKEHRKLDQTEKADEEIARGKRILEEAMRDYPDTTLVVQGEYLLANLAQELNNYQEAIGRYSHVISGWPDSEFAPTSQFKKAICYEKMGNYDQACEEYVKLTYVYPESTLVADATLRLGDYYYKKQTYSVASKIFYNFQQKNPQHRLAPQALFLAAQAGYKGADWKEATRLFTVLIDAYPDNKEIRPEAMYWLADSYFKWGQNAKAYQSFKKLTWDYPESKWAKIARGRLSEDIYAGFEETRDKKND
jgi:TolA-binding protein